jgi:murein DD-endopeptidase MepM/ murein hydrolase activator NlpD
MRLVNSNKAFWLVALVAIFSVASNANAQTVQTLASTLQSKIDQRNQDIQALQKEIDQYQKQIDSLNGQASTLASTIASLNATQKKLAADIKITEDKVFGKTLEIQDLASQITERQTNITDDKKIIASSFSMMRQVDNLSIIETLLSRDSLSDTVNNVTKLNNVQNELFSRIADIAKSKANLEQIKKKTEKAKADLESLKEQLKNQRAVVLSTTDQQNKLLKDTKQSESKYQDILAQKLQLKNAFEQELLSYESQLKTAVDRSKLPSSGSGVLIWPLDSIKITQFFGNTSFSTANPQIYNGKGHTGVDFRASIGTPVKAAGSGTVIGSANTDIIPSCYSYGRWVMIKHNNGLSTLYAHLSLTAVSIGQTVSAGQIIGYSGNTGYTTGPHLHFAVYASQGVEIQTLNAGMSKNCRGATMPIAPFSAYLNPLSYLPQY